ncbi:MULTISPECIES: DUF397 domain-containing protein [Streptomyces]|uniref:DUF397 domain-containing protein n=1 Tax=Streptomyces lycii TaxID=2654337 RepID=A0ABQ7FIE1_9ACTN|nr:DUF397 domain-containing protein [Streptomyces lycii]KAF4408378.1 DUF397 domain-containing protein [Streptomyces lycii]
MPAELNWFKSSYSEAAGNACVEVAVREDDGIAIRDSVFPERVLRTSRAGLAALVAGVRDGRSGRLPG